MSGGVARRYLSTRLKHKAMSGTGWLGEPHVNLKISVDCEEGLNDEQGLFRGKADG